MRSQFRPLEVLASDVNLGVIALTGVRGRAAVRFSHPTLDTSNWMSCRPSFQGLGSAGLRPRTSGPVQMKNDQLLPLLEVSHQDVRTAH